MIIHSGSFFTQNIKTVQTYSVDETVPETTYLCRDIINSKRQKRGKLSQVVQIGSSFLD